MPDYNRINLIVAIVGVVSGVIGVIFGSWYQKHLLEQSGAFRKSRLELSVMSMSLNELERDATTLIVRHPTMENEPAIFPVAFSVRNTGDAASEDVVLTLTAPKWYLPSLPESIVEKTVTPAAVSNEVRRATAEQGYFTQLSYVIPLIRPHSAVVIEEPFVLRPTRTEFDVDAVTKDAVPVRVRTRVAYSFKLVVAVISRADPPAQRHVSLMDLPGDSAATVAATYSADLRGQSTLSPFRDGLWKTVAKLRERFTRHHIIVVEYATKATVESAGGKLIMMDSPSSSVPRLTRFQL